MVGSQLPTPETRESTVTDVVELSVEHLTVRTDDGRPVVDDVTLQVRRGEVLGIAGVEGNGQVRAGRGAARVRAADRHRPCAGDDVSGWSTRGRREHGIGYVPEDRHRPGPAAARPLWENRVLATRDRRPWRRPWIDRRRPTRHRAIVREYGVRTPGIEVPAFALSAATSRSSSSAARCGEPTLLVASHPTRGVDVGAQAAVWDALRTARAKGLAVLLISADLEELIGLSDRLVVMLRGRLVAEVDPASTTPESLGGAMTGAAVA
jgi:simple sugar transport system ATP-binding protein